MEGAVDVGASEGVAVGVVTGGVSEEGEGEVIVGVSEEGEGEVIVEASEGEEAVVEGVSLVS